MGRLVSLLLCVTIVASPLITFAATQPKSDWFGGEKGVVYQKSLSEISAEAANEAAFYGYPIEYKTPDGNVVLEAYPNFGESPCESVYVEAWDHEKLVMKTTKEFCEVSYPVPEAE